MPILVFIGKEESIPGASRTSAIVLKLVEELHHKGHHLYCDNYYTSPALFLALRNLGFGAVELSTPIDEGFLHVSRLKIR